MKQSRPVSTAAPLYHLLLTQTCPWGDIVFAFLVLVTVVSTAHANMRPQYEAILCPSNAYYISARQINNDGLVLTAENQTPPRVWNSRTDSLFLAIAGSDSLHRLSIQDWNNSEQMCGYVRFTEDDFGMHYFWDGSAFHELLNDHPPPTYDLEIAIVGLNDHGDVYGSVVRPVPGQSSIRQAAFWQGGGERILLDHPSPYPDDYSSQVSGGNAQGDLVGTVVRVFEGGPDLPRGRAVLWRGGGEPVDLGEPPNSLNGHTHAYQINDLQWISAYAEVDPYDGNVCYHAFIWRDGTWTDLHENVTNPYLSTSTSFIPNNINNEGFVAGHAHYGYGNYNRAFLWVEGTMYGLDELVVNIDELPDAAPGHARFRAVYDLNESGDILAVTDNDAYYLRRLPSISEEGSVVNSVGDDEDAHPGDGVCDTGNLVGGFPECTLRAAIQEANAHTGRDTIGFSIPGGGIPTIRPESPLPVILGDVQLDGGTQSDAGLVEINGSAMWPDTSVSRPSDNGLVVSGGNSFIRGLLINQFTGNGLTLSQGDSNRVEHVTLGTDPSGAENLGNWGDGLHIANSSHNRIGDAFPDQFNTMAFNGAAGIFVSNGIGNTFRSNRIYSNGGLGIDLSPLGVTGNDDGDIDEGANDLQNFPVIDSVEVSALATRLFGHITSTPHNAMLLEFFVCHECDSSGYGEGRESVWTTMVNVGAGGEASIDVSLPHILSDSEFLSLTATDQDGSTSEFSHCWPEKYIRLEDALGNPLVENSFLLYRVAGKPPSFTDELIGSVQTNEEGGFYLRHGNLQPQDTVKIYCRVSSHPSPFPVPGRLNSYSIDLDNAAFDSLSFALSYDTLDTSPEQTIVLDHTTLALNLLVSIEWDASVVYQDSLASSYRNLSNYFYDVFDGQVRLDTVLIVDDKRFWDEADIMIHTSNMMWPNATIGGIGSDHSCGVHMPRTHFGNKSKNRNFSATINPLNPDISQNYRTKGHELGHYAFYFYDEYKFTPGTNRCPQIAHYGFMDSQYNLQSGSELSNPLQYALASCQNTDQFVGNANMSCWESFEQRFQGSYANIWCEIRRPGERTLPVADEYFNGPNDFKSKYTVTLDYDVGALVAFPQAPAPQTGSNVLAAAILDDGTPIPMALVQDYRSDFSHWRTQGRTADSGFIYILGMQSGAEVRVCGGLGRIISKRNDADLGRGAEYQWRYGLAELGKDGVSRLGNRFRAPGGGNPSSLLETVDLEITLLDVMGEYPLILKAVPVATGMVVTASMANPFPSEPRVNLETEVGGVESFVFTVSEDSYTADIAGDLSQSGQLTFWAEDDSAHTFFFPATYTFDESNSEASTLHYQSSSGAGEFSIDSGNSLSTAGLLLTTPYPPLLDGLDSETLQAGQVHSLYFSAAGPQALTGDNRVIIGYEDLDIAGGDGNYGEELSLRVFRWADDQQLWTPVGGTVDTMRNLVSAPIDRTGIYGAFTTDNLLDIQAPRGTLGVLQNPILPAYVEVYVSADEELREPPLVTADGVALEVSPVAGGSTPLYSARYELEGQGIVVLMATLIDQAGNMANLSKTFETIPVGVTASSFASCDGRLRLTVPEQAYARDDFLLLFVEDSEKGAIFELKACGALPARSLEIGLLHRLAGKPVDPTAWAICRLSDLEGQPLETSYEPASGMFVAHIDQPGRFQIQSVIPQDEPLRTQPALWPSKPNPSPSSTVIEFYLTRPARTRLEIFDATGRRIAELIDAPLEAGYHRLVWDGMLAGGHRAPAGVYMYRLRSGSYSATRKLIIIR